VGPSENNRARGTTRSTPTGRRPAQEETVAWRRYSRAVKPSSREIAAACTSRITSAASSGTWGRRRRTGAGEIDEDWRSISRCGRELIERRCAPEEARAEARRQFGDSRGPGLSYVCSQEDL